jgi:hypothetical protein
MCLDLAFSSDPAVVNFLDSFYEARGVRVRERTDVRRREKAGQRADNMAKDKIKLRATFRSS